MATQENIGAVKAFTETFNRRDWDGIGKLCRKEVEWTDVPGARTWRGPEEVAAWLRTWSDAFPDGRMEVTRVQAGADFAVAEGSFRGQQTGPFAGPSGELPASGRQVEFGFCVVFEFKNGRVLRAQAYPDLMTAMRQMGAIEGRAAEAWQGAAAM